MFRTIATIVMTVSILFLVSCSGNETEKKRDSARIESKEGTTSSEQKDLDTESLTFDKANTPSQITGGRITFENTRFDLTILPDNKSILVSLLAGDALPSSIERGFSWEWKIDMPEEANSECVNHGHLNGEKSPVISIKCSRKEKTEDLFESQIKKAFGGTGIMLTRELPKSASEERWISLEKMIQCWEKNNGISRIVGYVGKDNSCDESDAVISDSLRNPLISSAFENLDALPDTIEAKNAFIDAQWIPLGTPQVEFTLSCAKNANVLGAKIKELSQIYHYVKAVKKDHGNRICQVTNAKRKRLQMMFDASVIELNPGYETVKVVCDLPETLPAEGYTKPVVTIPDGLLTLKCSKTDKYLDDENF